MADASEDLRILYRAVSRRQGRSIVYAGCVTRLEAERLVELGLARLIDFRMEDSPDHGPNHGPDGAETLRDATPITWPRGADSETAQAGFIEALRRVAGTGETLLFISAATRHSHAAATMAAKAGFHGVLNVLDGYGCQPISTRSPGAEATARSTNSRFSGEAKVSMKS